MKAEDRRFTAGQFLLSRTEYFRICGMMSVRVRVDRRGRIVLPKEFRDALGISEGDEVVVMLEGGRVIIEKAEDPLKVLEEVLGGLSFSRELRRVAEEEGLKELRER